MTSHETAKFTLSDGSTIAAYREPIGPTIWAFDDPGGPILRDSQDRWIMPQPWTDFWNPPHAGTTRRTKRLTAIGMIP